jgi:hypothetical protein
VIGSGEAGDTAGADGADVPCAAALDHGVTDPIRTIASPWRQIRDEDADRFCIMAALLHLRAL